VPPNSFIDNTMKEKTNKLVSMDCIEFGDWLIKASQMKGYVLLVMCNLRNGKFVMQHVDDVKKANIIVEYVIEKGEL
jgi:hypothetical protein